MVQSFLRDYFSQSRVKCKLISKQVKYSLEYSKELKFKVDHWVKCQAEIGDERIGPFKQLLEIRLNFRPKYTICYKLWTEQKYHFFKLSYPDLFDGRKIGPSVMAYQ